MRTVFALTLTLIVFGGFAGIACAGDLGTISTDRFGYTGSTTKYATLDDALGGTNPVETITIGNRDLSLYVVNGYGAGTDENVIMGSWWYSTDPEGRPGYDNTRGNTGVGFLQVYDEDASTDTSLSMTFDNYSGGYWTEFDLTLTGTNAVYADPSNDYARFSPFSSNTADKGTYLNYTLTLTATGLEGVATAGGVIEATNHPTGVTGTFSGLFQNLGGDPAKEGYYAFSLALDMTNWSWESRDELTYPTGPPSDVYGFPKAGFQDSYFATVPEPGSVMLLVGGLAVALAGGARRRR